MAAKLRTENDVHGQVVNTVACTVKIKIPDTLAHRLNGLPPVVSSSVARMLRNRDESSSRYYPELPCVISKSLIAIVFVVCQCSVNAWQNGFKNSGDDMQERNPPR